MDWVPRSVLGHARDIERTIADLEGRLGRAPTDEEIARKLGLSHDELEESLGEISRSSVVALDELWTVSSGGDPVSLIDTIEDTQGPNPQAALAETELKEAIGEALARLPEREKLVVTLYWYEDLTLHEIGEVLSVTESRVSQLHTKAILRLEASLAAAAAAIGTRE
jgi:RNA polymerase sigma factor FliA